MTVNPEDDEVWTTRDGRELRVGEMTEDHVRNALRMILRNQRRRHRQRLELIAKDENLPFDRPYAIDGDDGGFDRPDNHAILAHLRRRHGDAVRVVGESVAGMSGANVYVGDRKVGWFGGIG